LDGIAGNSNKEKGGKDEMTSLFVIVACQTLDHLDEALVRPG